MRRVFALAVMLPLIAVAGSAGLVQPFGEMEPVKAGELLKVDFRASVVAGASVESNPAAATLLTLGACVAHPLPAGARFPRVRVRFCRADGRTALKETWLVQGEVMVYSQTPTAFRHAVYVPDGASFAQLVVDLQEKGNAVAVSDIVYAHADGLAEPTRNINPSFDFGLYNASGYSFMGSPRWRVAADGTNWFDLREGSCYPDPFPVVGGEELEIRFRGDSPTWLHCYVCFYEDWSKVGDLNRNKKFFVLDVHNARHRRERVERFDVPLSATWARVYFQPTGEIRDLRVTGRRKGRN